MSTARGVHLRMGRRPPGTIRLPRPYHANPTLARLSSTDQHG